MPALISSRNRRIGTRPPTWPFRLNPNSPQADGLTLWYSALTDVQGRAIDLSQRHNSAVVKAMPLAFTRDEGLFGWDLQANIDEIDIADGGIGLSIPAEFTFALTIHSDNQAGTNPGVWRSTNSGGTIGQGTSFYIMQNTTDRRPWVRINGTDLISAASGAGIPANQTARVVLSVKSGNTRWYLNGKLEHSSVTTFTAPSEQTIGQLGWQFNTGQWLGGKWIDVRFYNKAHGDAFAKAYHDPATRWDLYAPRRTFVAVPAGAALTEAIAPNTVLATANLQDTGFNAPPINTADIDDEPVGSPGPDANWWTAVNVGLATDARVGFATPSTGTPTGTQTFYIWARKTTGTQNPTVDVELWEAGSFVATLLNDVEITSTTGQLLTATFNAAGSPPSLTNPADVEIRIVSTPGVAA